MKNLAKEGARITLQISARLLQRLQEAAELRGTTLKQFVVQAALKDADRTIGREKMEPTLEDGAPRIGPRGRPGSEDNTSVSAPEQDKNKAGNDASGDDSKKSA